MKKSHQEMRERFPAKFIMQPRVYYYLLEQFNDFFHGIKQLHIIPIVPTTRFKIQELRTLKLK